MIVFLFISESFSPNFSNKLRKQITNDLCNKFRKKRTKYAYYPENIVKNTTKHCKTLFLSTKIKIIKAVKMSITFE